MNILKFEQILDSIVDIFENETATYQNFDKQLNELYIEIITCDFEDRYEKLTVDQTFRLTKRLTRFKCWLENNSEKP